MKTVFRNIALSALVAAGMVMTTSTVSAQPRERNARSANKERVTEGSVSKPKKKSGNVPDKVIRHVTENSSNANANHWPNVSSPSQLRKGENARPGTKSSKSKKYKDKYDDDDYKKYKKNYKRYYKDDDDDDDDDYKKYKKKYKHYYKDYDDDDDDDDDDYKDKYKKYKKYNGNGYIVTRPSSWSTPVAPPARTSRPADFIITRPNTHKGYKPLASAPRITGILGLVFGSSYYNSLDYFYNRGYQIDGYYGNKVYLRNVNEMSLFWPDAIFNYSSRGYLESAEFHYSTTYYDYSRFKRLYTSLCNTYGVPVSHKNKGKGKKIETIWYGSDYRGYITLTYRYKGGRYYTTLAYAY